MTHLWGKSQAQRDADRQQVLFEREEIARRDEDLRLRRAPLLQPVCRDYHFGTDIPAPTWREVEEARAMRGDDDAGHSGTIGILALLAIIIVAAAIRVII